MHTLPLNSSPLVSRRAALEKMVLAIACSGLWCTVRTQEPSPITIYFYSPETNVNNFSVLKGEFDTLLAPLGGHRFQPFSDRDTFESRIAAGARGLFLLSSWHYSQIAGRYALDPLLIGHTRGKAVQKHHLFSQTSNLADLRGQKIATAGSRDFALNLLNDILPGQQELIATWNLLVVPKDIDALMAVGFGAARAAIATENGAEKLAKLNQKQRENLKQIGSGRESLLPVLAAPRNSGSDVKAIAKLFSSMDLAPEGKSRLQLLGLEAMRELSAEQNERLTR